MATKKLHFETLQVHVGQEQADPATDARASLFIRQHLMYFMIHSMLPTVSPFAMSGIFMVA